ncbi:CPBP family intramembrane metalloprotease [Aliiglaciecola sp. CAU 1673]|uniref:CPBP family intramembrane glutamic endopeptidase n=1 Tax=Aliiglaciecola sp. CAU 1673 TaxID=3032595 RepID=UPI0023DA27A0|nr:CPBP family intramembrane glutamic endopeptidase [Aliiglaciecola sp. CAU 1673]MDF2178876.1 CPBP family intramembrane metalloprotease [Aliiglaciecola sp. CAU 1673]
MNIAEQWQEPLPFVLLLLVTWICTALKRQPLSSVGLKLNGRWWSEFSIGTGLGIGQLALISLILWSMGGVHFALNTDAGAQMLITGLYMFLFGALFEELLHRGFLFQRLLDGIGIWPAQILVALIFAAGHWDNPNMDGMTKVIASIELALASLMLGLAYIRTRSLGLAVGLHLGWNFAQGSLFGFAVSGHQQSGLLTPQLTDLPQWISGGNFGLEAGALAIIADLLVLLALYRWRGTVQYKLQPAFA